MAELEEFDMSKLNSSVFNYPIVIRKVGFKFFISVPDLGFWKEIKLTENSDDKISSISAKSLMALKNNNQTLNSIEDVFDLTPELQKNIMSSLMEIWKEIDTHLKTKKWIPDPSQIKQSLQVAEQDFTLPDFTKKLNQYMSISENTVRREIQRGAIQCYQTEGGHRRIPFSELDRYVSQQKNSQKQQATL